MSTFQEVREDDTTINVGAQDVQAENNLPVEESTKKITRRYIKGLRPARVTRISIENPLEDSAQFSKPRLKQGIHISQANSDDP